jgi:hypothetical protein
VRLGELWQHPDLEPVDAEALGLTRVSAADLISVLESEGATVLELENWGGFVGPDMEFHAKVPGTFVIWEVPDGL